MNLEGFEPGEGERGEMAMEDRWILSALARLIREVDARFEAYNFSEACKALYDFFWSDFCDWYLEMAKPRLYGEDVGAKNNVKEVLLTVLEKYLRLAHPVMPFITEDIWQRLPHQGESIMMAEWPEAREEDLDPEAEAEMGYLREVITGIRRIRSELRIPPSRQVPVELLVFEEAKRRLAEANLHHLISQARLSEVNFVERIEDPSAYARGLVEATEIFVPMQEMADFSDEIKRIEKELARLEQDAEKSRAKLANQQYIDRAPRRGGGQGEEQALRIGHEDGEVARATRHIGEIGAGIEFHGGGSVLERYGDAWHQAQPRSHPYPLPQDGEIPSRTILPFT